ncbi:MAG: phytanoyl-CoA dioxygenase family protein [Pseudomonadota bacterium]
MTQTLAEHLSAIAERGYTIVHDAVLEETRLELLAAIQELKTRAETYKLAPRDSSWQGFSGSLTKRVRHLASRHPAFHAAVLNPAVLEIVDAVLGPEPLLHATQLIEIGPGEGLQAIHTDDMYMKLPRPHFPVILNAMWALTDFYEANGATRIVPFSHAWEDQPGASYADVVATRPEYASIPAEMPAGSILIYDGAMWHGGGANQTDTDRIGMAVLYSRGWMRQQDNVQLSMPRAEIANLPPRLQELCGFGRFQQVIGTAPDGGKPLDMLLEQTA